MAQSLRQEAAKLQEQAKRLIGAADVLDPTSRQVNIPGFYEAVVATEPRERYRIRTRQSTAQIAEMVLRENGGPMSRDNLFNKAKEHGSPITDLANFASVLSRAENLFSLGNGLWDLLERHPGKGGSH